MIGLFSRHCVYVVSETRDRIVQNRDTGSASDPTAMLEEEMVYIVYCPHSVSWNSVTKRFVCSGGHLTSAWRLTIGQKFVLSTLAVLAIGILAFF